MGRGKRIDSQPNDPDHMPQSGSQYADLNDSQKNTIKDWINNCAP